jgi:hypothetical protein
MTTKYIEKFWRNATAADVARVMNGETVEARFRDRETEEWTSPQRLIGTKFPHGTKLLWICGAYGWWFCQVYAPPQWFLNKPEPGEGYRLLGKEPDEPVQGGDFIRGSGGWIELANGCNPAQVEGIWYRRRIEPKPEPKHYVLQVGDTVETPSGRQAIVTELGIEVS